MAFAQDGGRVVFPDNASVLLTFVKLEEGHLDTEVRGVIQLGLLLSKELLTRLAQHCTWWMVGVRSGNADSVVQGEESFK